MLTDAQTTKTNADLVYLFPLHPHALGKLSFVYTHYYKHWMYFKWWYYRCTSQSAVRIARFDYNYADPSVLQHNPSAELAHLHKRWPVHFHMYSQKHCTFGSNQDIWSVMLGDSSNDCFFKDKSYRWRRCPQGSTWAPTRDVWISCVTKWELCFAQERKKIQIYKVKWSF